MKNANSLEMLPSASAIYGLFVLRGNFCFGKGLRS